MIIQECKDCHIGFVDRQEDVDTRFYNVIGIDLSFVNVLFWEELDCNSQIQVVVALVGGFDNGQV
jgi:hypothetical protein